MEFELYSCTNATSSEISNKHRIFKYNLNKWLIIWKNTLQINPIIIYRKISMKKLSFTQSLWESISILLEQNTIRPCSERKDLLQISGWISKSVEGIIHEQRNGPGSLKLCYKKNFTACIYELHKIINIIFSFKCKTFFSDL